MRIKYFKYIILLAIVSIFVISLACSLPLYTSNSTEDTHATSDNIIASQPNAGDKTTDDLTSQMDDGFSYQITEAQMTAILQEAILTKPDLGISEPIVYLRDSHIEIHGNAKLSGVSLPLLITINLYIDAEKQLQYEITSAKIGPLPVPQIMLQQLSDYIGQSIDQSIAMDRNDIAFESISIDHGLLSISGYYR